MDSFDIKSARLKKIDEWIRKQGTGNSKELGRKIGCSPRTVDHYLEVLRFYLLPYGISVVFCPEFNSFIYTQTGHFEIMFVWVNAENEHLVEAIRPRKTSSPARVQKT
jgi:hypothetical protein